MEHPIARARGSASSSPARTRLQKYNMCSDLNLRPPTMKQTNSGANRGFFERKDEKMNLYCLKVHDLQMQFISCEILKVARFDKAKANALSRLVFMGVDGLDRTVHAKIVVEPNIAQKSSIMDIDHEPSWMDPIVDYITLTEVHEGICGNHQGARTLAYKLIRYGYYWPSLKKDAVDYVRKYDKCQRFDNIIHAPTEELTSIHYSALFKQWGVNILGSFPLASGKLKFVAMAVEYFTKWVEAEPLATISKPKLRSFIWKSVICRFGIPKVLITDYRRQFDNPQFRSFYANHGIDHHLTSISHPQSNGLAEDAKGDRPDKLPSILWAYRTSHKIATGEAPFMPAFGLEATIPIEVNLSTIRNLEINRERQTTEHLDLLEEVREQASLKAANYHNRTTKHFNNKAQTRRFRAGDLVLRKTEAAGHIPGKLGPAWEGPFEVIRKLKGGAYSLRDTSGKPLQRLWNVDNLKIYYK
ncbi:uncharacterized protein K02A2.6-like [Olea europaea var. sylvestris]|uniref:uncharacterized protein K02A2.6-like n=1 Tax=Olea europaea var. sylvestris TaxID=158386 RepID=UPI000C1D1B5F|nr:uncharacterized protein K02A2.6-like [Olea europaea var. sylvestris]